jgi:hypothetical protein
MAPAHAPAELRFGADLVERYEDLAPSDGVAVEGSEGEVSGARYGLVGCAVAPGAPPVTHVSGNARRGEVGYRVDVRDSAAGRTRRGPPAQQHPARRRRGRQTGVAVVQLRRTLPTELLVEPPVSGAHLVVTGGIALEPLGVFVAERPWLATVVVVLVVEDAEVHVARALVRQGSAARS